ncbi:membrane protein [Pseudomonas syringae]|uniref:Membrane protein n=1 Tax=Pseudomonas syringae TaxID=317 RepID=A0A085VKS5_PSESX|nr:membrane protein [Pseudomonas syringae]KFE56038.1 membrane protein [Pseudomonas syringae]
MKRLIGLSLLLAGVLYPFAVYYGSGHFAPWQFALLLGALWLGRAVTAAKRPGTLTTALIALGFCVLLGLFDSPELLRWYPVLISASMLSLFGLSLIYGPPIVERLARIREPVLPEVAIRYTRQVTKVWCCFFLANGFMAAALTLWAPLTWWALYTGLISYGLMGLLFAGEWLVRRRVRGAA